MALGRNQRAVGVFPTRREAEIALHELKDSGFTMDNVSVIARDADKHDDIADVSVDDRKDVGNKADDGAKAGAVTGGVLGGVTGLLVGLGALAIPGIGPIMLAGAEATALATTLAGGAIGAAAGGLVGALIGLGIPEERARVYNDRVERGQFLVMVNGTEADIQRAQAILSRHHIQEWGVYDAPDSPAAAVNPVGDVDRAPTLDPNLRADRDIPSKPSVDRNVITNEDPDVIIVDRRSDKTRDLP